MAHGSDDVYGNMGSVPKAPSDPVRVSGTGAGPMGEHANAEDFGGAIGAGIQNVGKAAEGLATEYGNMVNETQANNAEAALAVKIGNINAAYHTKTGMEAYNAYPVYQAAIQQAQLESRQGLTLGAGQSYDIATKRLIANHIADGSGYAATQLKAANIDSYSSLQNAHIQGILDPNIATSPERTGYNIGTAIHAEQAKMSLDNPGLKTDPQTGTVNFDESKPEGQQLKQQYQQNVDQLISQAKINQYTTLAKPDVMGVLPAHDLYQQERDKLPPQAQVALDSSFAPKVFNAHKDNAVGATLNDAAQAHSEMLYNPSGTSVNANNLGNVKTKAGAAQGTMDFVAPATPVDGVILTANTLKSGYQGMTLADIGKKWTGESPDKVDAWVHNVSNSSGIAPSETPDLNDPSQLHALLKGVAVAEKSPTDRSRFTDDVIAQGVQASMSGAKPMNAPEGGPKYGVNANGAPLSLADYYRTHSADVYAKGDAYAEQTMSGSLEFKRAVRQTLQNTMSSTIQNETQAHMADNRNVVQAINGAMTKGKPPETEAQLRAIPGMSDLLDKVASQDPKFAEGIPTMIAKMARQNVTTNSANGYDTVMRSLEPHDDSHPNHINNQDQLDRLLGRSDGTDINMKDYNDAKQVLDTDPTFKDSLRDRMQEITTANGNLDGKGQDRALQWYSQVMAAKKQNDALPPEKKLSDADFIASVGEKEGPPAPAPPSRMQQIANWAASAFKNKQDLPQVKSLDDYNAVPKGQKYTDPDGNVRTRQ